MNANKFLEAELENHAESHAYLLIGNRVEAEKVVNFVIETRNILPVDITVIGQEEDSAEKGIKVEDARQFLREISRSPQGKQRLAVIYGCEKLNASSGNVLLKNLEEPAGPVVFILISSTSSVLSTIKSRCRVLNLDNVESDNDTGEEEYIIEVKKGLPEAFSLIEKIAKEGKASLFLQELTANQRKKLLSEKKSIHAKNIEEIESARKKIGQNGNQRLVLECLILKIMESL